MTTLTDEYYRIRRELGSEAAIFEGASWEHGENASIRRAAGHTLKIYSVEGQFEVCIIYPDGTSRTFS